MITIAIGSNPTVGHYVLEHKIWVFYWVLIVRDGKVLNHNFIIKTKWFWYENNGKFKRFRLK